MHRPEYEWNQLLATQSRIDNDSSVQMRRRWNRCPTKRPDFTSLRKILESTISEQESKKITTRSLPKRPSTGLQKLKRALPKRTGSFQNSRTYTSRTLSEFSFGNTEGESMPFDVTEPQNCRTERFQAEIGNAFHCCFGSLTVDISYNNSHILYY